jgi:hypothetical protein
MQAIQTLLRASIDYAGLFPPAALDMATAVDHYARYRSSDDAWALGRFILPASRLAEFEGTAAKQLPDSSGRLRWPIAALAGPDLIADLDLIAAFNRRHASGTGPNVDTLELKASSVADVDELMFRVPQPLQAYVEIPIEEDPAELVAAIRRRGARAKVRTGGITRNAFPKTQDLARFLVRCITTRVAFKATAGLHHALRAEYRLTYVADSPCGVMFGFLNVFLAAALLRDGLGLDQAEELLEESSPQAFQVGEREISWRGHRLDLSALRGAREEAIVSFGSCSFSEPLEDLRALQLLGTRAQRT